MMRVVVSPEASPPTSPVWRKEPEPETVAQSSPGTKASGSIKDTPADRSREGTVPSKPRTEDSPQDTEMVLRELESVIEDVAFAAKASDSIKDTPADRSREGTVPSKP